jgi:hypothetical protein
MRKLKLDLDRLTVESFATGGSEKEGTVIGQNDGDVSVVVGGCYTFGCIAPHLCATEGAEESCLNTLKTCPGQRTCGAMSICLSKSFADSWCCATTDPVMGCYPCTAVGGP